MKKITNENLELLETVPDARVNVLREWRKPLLNALDIYDKNVSRGRISETAEEKAAVDKWYTALLDLEEWAFDSVPARIARYIKTRR